MSLAYWAVHRLRVRLGGGPQGSSYRDHSWISSPRNFPGLPGPKRLVAGRLYLVFAIHVRTFSSSRFSGNAPFFSTRS
jgi:hypothetical protein